MLNDFSNKIKINNDKLNNIDSNFLKLNSIMNQRLIGLVDYLKASIYFSHYNEKNTKKNKRNLEQFFKNKIFKKNPFSSSSIKNSFISNSENKINNSPLNIVVNFKNNKMIFPKNKYSTPYDLHSKKHNFFKNMVVFSKYIHNGAKIENDFRKKYPKIESFPINNNYLNYKNNLPLTPKIARQKLSIKTDGFTSTYDDKNSFFKNSKKQIKKRLKNIKTFLSFDNRNEKNENSNNIFNKSSNLFNNTGIKRNNARNKTIKSIKKANCYYNNLHLKKLSQNLLKYTYLNEE